jgi:hypothetical protein
MGSFPTDMATTYVADQNGNNVGHDCFPPLIWQARMETYYKYCRLKVGVLQCQPWYLVVSFENCLVYETWAVFPRIWPRRMWQTRMGIMWDMIAFTTYMADQNGNILQQILQIESGGTSISTMVPGRVVREFFYENRFWISNYDDCRK